MEIEIFELTNTHGCAWRWAGTNSINWSFEELPPSAKLWLECASGNAVQKILDAGIGNVVDSKPSAYGGECRTIRVDVETLETKCRAYWDAANTRYAKQQEYTSNCHYCGMIAHSTGFFGEPICKECS